ncbi:MAG TPA: hypothetical protein VGG84_05375 [Gemmatimonadaceae bacterium]|jgi:hypothetical protein
MRTFTDADGARWDVVLGKESWGTLVLLFSPQAGGAARTSILAAETMFAANAELDALTDDQLRVRLRDSRPWP